MQTAAYDQIADWYEHEFLGNGAPCGHVARDWLRRPLTQPSLARDRRLSRKDGEE